MCWKIFTNCVREIFFFKYTHGESSSTKAACEREICCDRGIFFKNKFFKQGASKYKSTLAAIMEIAHSAHWAACMLVATSATGFISSQVVFKEFEVL